MFKEFVQSFSFEIPFFPACRGVPLELKRQKARGTTCPDAMGCLVLGRHSPSWSGVAGWVAGNRLGLGRVCTCLAYLHPVSGGTGVATAL